MRSLFESVQLGSLVLANRVFMAPLTRNRANAEGVPSELAVTYYGQRASAGLIITEATQISPMGKGYINTPGIYSPEQVWAWRRIVNTVHQKGGRIFLQLWHVGRISHSWFSRLAEALEWLPTLHPGKLVARKRPDQDPRSAAKRSFDWRLPSASNPR